MREKGWLLLELVAGPTEASVICWLILLLLLWTFHSTILCALVGTLMCSWCSLWSLGLPEKFTSVVAVVRRGAIPWAFWHGSPGLQQEMVMGGANTLHGVHLGSPLFLSDVKYNESFSVLTVIFLKSFLESEYYPAVESFHGILTRG